MKKVISKLDRKEYYLAVCNDESNVMFICDNKYQVRKATADDCENPELYCIVNGTFNEPLSDLNGYGTTIIFESNHNLKKRNHDSTY